MSGHSKWATTKRKKSAIDAKRAKLFTKIAKLITIAARDGKSGDPTMNPGLRMAVENARAISMPKDNIERAIKRGIGEGGDGAALEEITYESYGPGGIGILIECLTDNKNRALSEVKNALTKNGGSIASAGSVSYLFKKAGQIIVDESKNEKKGDELEMTIIDSGALDFEKEDETYVITTSYQDLNSVRKTLEAAGLVIESSEIIQIPTTYIDPPESKKQNIENLLEALDDLDDVNNVFTNANL